MRPIVGAANLRSVKRNPRGDDKGRQNTSDAVMAQRGVNKDGLDDFPTPPWATRALLKYVIPASLSERVLEPAAGRGYMSEVLREFFGEVESYDIADYDYCPTIPEGFLADPRVGTHDWVITNPPFKLAEEFVRQGLTIARRGVALLCRTVIIESKGRYENLYSHTPPSVVAQFVERVPMVQGRVDPIATTATGYCWMVWDKAANGPFRPRLYPTPDYSILQAPLAWIPPCRKQLERVDDYLLPIDRL